MKSITKMISSILNWIENWCMGDIEEKYILVRPEPVKGCLEQKKKEVVPFALHSQVPNLGKNHDRLIKRAEVLFNDDDLRLKWLLAIHKMREGEIEYIMEPMTGDELKNRKHSDIYPKWASNPVPNDSKGSTILRLVG